MHWQILQTRDKGQGILATTLQRPSVLRLQSRRGVWSSRDHSWLEQAYFVYAYSKGSPKSGLPFTNDDMASPEHHPDAVFLCTAIWMQTLLGALETRFVCFVYLPGISITADFAALRVQVHYTGSECRRKCGRYSEAVPQIDLASASGAHTGD